MKHFARGAVPIAAIAAMLLLATPNDAAKQTTANPNAAATLAAATADIGEGALSQAANIADISNSAIQAVADQEVNVATNTASESKAPANVKETADANSIAGIVGFAHIC